MAANYACTERRPLKRPRLGPPDVYPQELKQSEDELTPEKVNKGYAYRTPLVNEYESARSVKLEEKLDEFATKLTHNYNAILTKKSELNALHDIAKKKAGFKDSFWHSAAAKSKTQDVWFRDLAGSKPLATLAKKAPFFHKKDEMFTTLADMNIPVCRAVWFIKLNHAYYNAQQESGKIKKKQITDAGNDWMQHLFKFLSDVLSKLKDYYAVQNLQTQAAVPLGYDVAALLKQWTYCTQLGRYMYEEGLFDKHEYLTLLLEMFAEKCRSNDDGLLKLIIPIVMKHMDGFLQYELHCRNLAYYCCKKLAIYYLESDTTGSPPSASTDLALQKPQQQQQSYWYDEQMSCPFHRYILISLSAIVHSILVDCPTALVWNGLETNSPYATDTGKFAYLCGSPLDHMMCFPSQLPMAQGPNTDKIMTVIRGCEEEIRKRSATVESHWSFDKCHESGVGSIVSTMLVSLETLDKHRFDICTEATNIDRLCQSVFQGDNKDLQEGSDKMIIFLLCHWAVTAHRFGNHRALAVVRILEKRQLEIEENLRATGSSDPPKQYCFQQALFEYLDSEAPTFNEKAASAKSAAEFSNLAVVFGELIRADLFSHDDYVSTLISRGDLTSNTYLMFQPLHQHQRRSGMETDPGMHPTAQAEEREFGDAKSVDGRNKSDIEKLLSDRFDKATAATTTNSDTMGGRSEKAPLSVGSSCAPGSVDPQFPPSVESQPGFMSGPGSIGPPMSSFTSPAAGPSTTSNTTNTNAVRRNSNSSSSWRHWCNILHFPIPSDDQYKHDRNQRQALIYGFGGSREKQKHIIKKMIKELNKLWHKKNSVECASGGVLRLKRKIESRSLKALLAKFQELVAYDQYAVIDSCADACLDQIGDFIDGKTNYLPSVENVDFFMGVMELAKNLGGGLMEFIEALVMQLSRIEQQLHAKGCATSAAYVLNQALGCVGFLRKYDTYAALCVDEMRNIWGGLFDLLSKRPIMSACPSAERCLWNFLRTTYENCEFLHPYYEENWRNAGEAFRRCDYGKIEKVAANLKFDPNFAASCFESPKRKLDERIVTILGENPGFRYSFVVSAVLAVVGSKSDPERLFDLVQLCADVTALHPPLASEWVDILKAMCFSSIGVEDVGYKDCLAKINLSDFSVHFALSTLVFNLVGRHCVRMEELVLHVCLQTLLILFRQVIDGGMVVPNAEPGARLALHMFGVLCLAPDCFNTQTGAIQSIYAKTLGYSYLACSAQSNMVPEALLVLLIISLVLGESISDGTSSSTTGEGGHDNTGIREALGLAYEAEDVEAWIESSKAALGFKSLSGFACDLLNTICQQEWTKRKFCQACHATDLFTTELLLDPHIKHTQAQKLLHMMTRSIAEGDLVRDLEQSARTSSNKKDFVGKLFRSVTLWNLNTSLLDLQLLLKQAASGASTTSETQLIDTIGRAAMDVFQGENNNNSSTSSSMSSSSYTLPVSPKKGALQQQQQQQQQLDSLKISELSTSWLVAPLVERLPANVQGRVLKAAATVLETGQLSRKEKTNLQQSSSLLSQQPFLLLVLTCLRGQDEQRESLLASLLKQLQEYVARIKEDQLQLCNRVVVAELTEALQLRLSLVGGMFETIFRSPMLESWAILLLQLILYGIVSVENDSRLFYACLDMLTILLHSCLVVDLVGGSDRSMEEGRKLYSTIIRKAKKEIAERRLPLIRCVNQLLPIPRQWHEVIVCEPYGSQPAKTNAKGMVIPATPAPLDMSHRKGLQVAGKERVNPWDIIEGYRGDNGLKWSWFQAVKVDYQPDTLTRQLQRLLPHDHYHQCDRRPLQGDVRPDPYLEPLKVRYDDALLAAMEAEKGGGRKEPCGGVSSEQQHHTNPSSSAVPTSLMGMVGRMNPGQIGPGGVGIGGAGMCVGPEGMMIPEQPSPRGKAPRKKPSSRGRKNSRGGLAAATAAAPMVQYGTMPRPPSTGYGGGLPPPQPLPPPMPPAAMMSYGGAGPGGAVSAGGGGGVMISSQPAPSYANIPPSVSWSTNQVVSSQPPSSQVQPPRSAVTMSPFMTRPHGTAPGVSSSAGGAGNVVAGSGKQAIAHLISQRTAGQAIGTAMPGGGMQQQQHGQQVQQSMQQHQFGNQPPMNPTNDPTFGHQMQQAQMHMEHQRNQLIQEGMADPMRPPAGPHRQSMPASSVPGPAAGMMSQQHMMQQQQQPMYQQHMQQPQQQQMQQSSQQQHIQPRPPPAYSAHVGMPGPGQGQGQGPRMPGQQQVMQQQQPPPQQQQQQMVPQRQQQNFNVYQQQQSQQSGIGDYNQQPASDATSTSSQAGFYGQQISQQQQSQAAMMQQQQQQQQQQQSRMQQERMAQARYGPQMSQGQPYSMQQQQPPQQQQQRPAGVRQMAPYMMQQQQPGAQPPQQQQQPAQQQHQQQQMMDQQQQQQMSFAQQQQQQQEQQRMYHQQQMPRQMSQQYGNMPPGDRQGGMYY